MRAETGPVTGTQAGAAAPRGEVGQGRPDPEVVTKPTRRRFTAEYRLWTVEEAVHGTGLDPKCRSFPHNMPILAPAPTRDESGRTRIAPVTHENATRNNLFHSHRKWLAIRPRTGLPFLPQSEP